MKLIDALNIVRSAPRRATQSLNVALVCGFTPLHLKTFLAASLQRALPDRRIDVHTGLYGDLLGNIERAADSAPDAVAIALEWPDFDPRLGVRAAVSAVPDGAELRNSTRSQMHRIQQVIDRRLAKTTIALSLPTIPAQSIRSQPSWLANGLETALLKCLADFAEWASGRNHIRLLNLQGLDERSPSSSRWNVVADLSSGFPYQLSHAAVLADLLSRLIHPPQPKKGLITDLDDTLWKGIVGEIGVGEISWSLDRQSHHHALYQQQLHALADAGVLVAAASKNDPDVVRQAFARSDLLVDSSSIFPVEASWKTKSAAVRRILDVWNVGPESIVFVDDSPLELAEVQSAIPDVTCLLFPKSDPVAAVALLNRLRDMFGKHSTSEEDRLRLNSVRRAAESAPPRETGRPLDEFLQQAEAEITLSEVKDPLDSRTLELINKTNQFNLNGRRYTNAEWLAYLNEPGSRLLVASYADRYGKLGKVAVIGARAAGNEFVVDTWVMSCRAFSRRIEHRCIEHLFRKFELTEVSFDFQPTSRNIPIQEFFTEFLGSKPAGRLRLSDVIFKKKCPALFHTIRNL